MNAQTAIRPAVLERETFQAFVVSSGALTGIGKALPLDTASDLAEAVQIGTLSTPHKGHFFVRQTDAFTGASLLKFYSVKRKAKAAYRYHEYTTRAVNDLYAEHLFDLSAPSEWSVIEGGAK